MQRATVAGPILLLPLLAVAAMHGAAVARHKAAHHEPAVAAMHGAAVAHGDGPRAGMQGASVTSPLRPPCAKPQWQTTKPQWRRCKGQSFDQDQLGQCSDMS